MAWDDDKADEFEDAVARKDYLKAGDMLMKHGQEMVAGGYYSPEALADSKRKVSGYLKQQYPKAGERAAAMGEVAAPPNTMPPATGIEAIMPRSPSTEAEMGALLSDIDMQRMAGAGGGMTVEDVLNKTIGPRDTYDQRAALIGQAQGPGQAMLGYMGGYLRNAAHDVAGLAPYVAAGLAGPAAPLALMGGQLAGGMANAAAGGMVTDPQTGQRRAATAGDALESVNVFRPVGQAIEKVQKYGLREGLGRAAYEGDLLGGYMGGKMVAEGAAGARKLFRGGAARANADLDAALAGPAESARPAEGGAAPDQGARITKIYEKLQELEGQGLEGGDPIHEAVSRLNDLDVAGEQIPEQSLAQVEAQLGLGSPGITGMAFEPVGGLPDPASFPEGDPRRQLAEMYQARARGEGPGEAELMARREKRMEQYRQIEAELEQALDRRDTKAARVLRGQLQTYAKELKRLTPESPVGPGDSLETRSLPLGRGTQPALAGRDYSPGRAALVDWRPGEGGYSQIGYQAPERYQGQLPDGVYDAQAATETTRDAARSAAATGPNEARVGGRLAEYNRLAAIRDQIQQQNQMGMTNVDPTLNRGGYQGGLEAQMAAEEQAQMGMRNVDPNLDPSARRPNWGPGRALPSAERLLLPPAAGQLELPPVPGRLLPPSSGGQVERPGAPLPDPLVSSRQRGGYEYGENEGPLSKPPTDVIQVPAERPDTFAGKARVSRDSMTGPQARRRIFRSPEWETLKKKVPPVVGAALAVGGAYSYLTAKTDEEKKRASGLLSAAVMIPVGGMGEVKRAIAEGAKPLETPLRPVSYSENPILGGLQSRNFTAGSNLAHTKLGYEGGMAEAAAEVKYRNEATARGALDYLTGKEGGHKDFETMRQWMREQPPEIWRWIKKTIQKRAPSLDELRALRAHPEAQRIVDIRDRLQNLYQAFAEEMKLPNKRQNYYPNTEPDIGRKTLALRDKEPGGKGSGLLDEGSLEHRREFENYDPSESPLDTLDRYVKHVQNRQTNQFVRGLQVLEKRLRGAQLRAEADNVVDYIDRTIHHQSGVSDYVLTQGVLKLVARGAAKVKVGDRVEWDGTGGFTKGTIEVEKDGGAGQRGHNFYVKVNGKAWPMPLTAEQLAFMKLPSGVRAMTDAPVAKLIGTAKRFAALKFIWGNVRTFMSSIPENLVRAASSKVDPFTTEGREQWGRGISDAGKFITSAISDRTFAKAVLEKMERYGLHESGKVRMDAETPGYEWIERLNHSWPVKLGYLNVTAPDFMTKLPILLTQVHAEAARINSAYGGDIFKLPESAWRKAAVETFKITDAHHQLMQTPGSKNGAYQLAVFLRRSALKSAAHLAEITGEAAQGKWSRLGRWLLAFGAMSAATAKALRLDTDEGAELVARWIPFGDLFLKSTAQAAGLVHGSPEQSAEMSASPIYDYLSGVYINGIRGLREMGELGDLPTLKTAIQAAPVGSSAVRTAGDLPEGIPGLVTAIGNLLGGDADPGAATRRLFIRPSKRDLSPGWSYDDEKRQTLKRVRKEAGRE